MEGVFRNNSSWPAWEIWSSSQKPRWRHGLLFWRQGKQTGYNKNSKNKLFLHNCKLLSISKTCTLPQHAYLKKKGKKAWKQCWNCNNNNLYRRSLKVKQVDIKWSRKSNIHYVRPPVLSGHSHKRPPIQIFPVEALQLEALVKRPPQVL